MSNGQFVDGEDDFLDNDEELERILYNEAPEEIQVLDESFPFQTGQIFFSLSWATESKQ